MTIGDLPTHLTGRQLAQCIGVSERRVRSLHTEGIIHRAARDRYPITAVAEYAAHLREVAAGRGGEAGVRDLTAERARLAAAQADHHEIRVAQARGELVPADRVAATWADILRRVRSRVLAAPSRIRQRLPHLTAADTDAINQELRDALAELAQGDQS